MEEKETNTCHNKLSFTSLKSALSEEEALSMEAHILEPNPV